MKLLTLLKKYESVIVSARHHLHQYPETAFEEYQTSAYIRSMLESHGIDTIEVMAKTGLVVLIQSTTPGKTVLLRADMDALPVKEASGVAFSSTIEGVMHACGHDGHCATMIGVALILNEMRDAFSGCVKIIFQPAEEKYGGAKPMIEAGVLDNPKVDAAFGFHLWGPVKEGMITIKEGPMMASPDTFHLTIKGVGGHGAMPQLSIDPVVCMANIIMSLQTIVSREIDPLKPAVLTCAQIKGGSESNVIPGEVTLHGTVRTFDEYHRTYMEAAMKRVITGICMAHNTTFEFEYKREYPALINDAVLTQQVCTTATTLFGASRVEILQEPSMGGEDFAYFGQHVPAAYCFLGIAKDLNHPPIHHHPEFGFDDNILSDATQLMCTLALDFLRNNE